MRYVFISILMLGFFIPAFPDNDYLEAKDVAVKGFKRFIASCLDGDERGKQHFALGRNDLIENAILGDGYKLHLISPDHITKYGKGTRINDCYKTIDTYLFPVILNGTMKCMISVEKYENQETYAIGSLGFKWLAVELEKVLKHWSLAKGYSLKIVNNPQTDSYAFTVPEKNNTNLTLFDFDSDKNGTVYSSLSSLEAVMNELKKSLKTILSGEDR